MALHLESCHSGPKSLHTANLQANTDSLMERLASDLSVSRRWAGPLALDGQCLDVSGRGRVGIA